MEFEEKEVQFSTHYPIQIWMLLGYAEISLFPGLNIEENNESQGNKTTKQ